MKCVKRSTSRMIKIGCLVIGLVNSCFISAQTNYSLIVAEYNPAEAQTITQIIYKYTFSNDEFKGKEKLLAVKGRVNGTDQVRCDVGNNVLYKNRYLITGIGNVIDLKEKKVVSNDKAKLVKCSGDSIVFYTNDIFKGKYYSVFNCKTNKYEEVKALLFKPIIGQDIGVDYDKPNRRILLYPPKKEKVILVSDAGFGENLLNTKSSADIPVHWLDNNNFVYPHYNQAKNEATIYKVNVNKTQTKLGVIKDIPPSYINSYFSKDENGNLVYDCAKGEYIIDLKNNKIIEVLNKNVGNNFEVECKTQSYGHTIFFEKNEIGKYFFDLKTVKTNKVAVVVNKQMLIQNEVYPQGLAVWNKTSKKWKNIDAENVASVIGWIEE